MTRPTKRNDVVWLHNAINSIVLPTNHMSRIYRARLLAYTTPTFGIALHPCPCPITTRPRHQVVESSLLIVTPTL